MYNQIQLLGSFGGFGEGKRTVVEMSTLSKELIFLILQFFDDEGFKETAHMLERESGIYFDIKHFEDMVLGGKWDEAERYLSGFTEVDDNRFSTKIYFEIRKQNFLEALDNNDRAKALDILKKDLKAFAEDNEELFKEMTLLLTYDDIRDHDSLSMYGDTMSARKIMMHELKKIIEANPLFSGKLKFPSIKCQRLRRIINQGLNWQHTHCSDPHPDPNIETLFVDHVCEPRQNISYDQSTENSPLPSHDTELRLPTSPASWNSSPSTISHSAICSAPSGAISLDAPVNPDQTMEDLEDSDNISNRGTFETLDEVTSTLTDPGQIHGSISNISYDLPKTVARTLIEGSSPMSMDFHPVHQTVLLVGTDIGEIGLWDVNSGQKLVSKNFTLWDVGSCSMILKVALIKDPCVSVNRIIWSPDGYFFGIAYSKHIVQLYSYHGGNDVQQKLEIDAHVGAVNDLAFSTPNKNLLVITCGEDKTIKVWDVASAVKMHTFEGHDAPVISVCPHTKESINFIFSTSVDGKIKAWLYDNSGSRVDFDAPGFGCTTMAYSADDMRLFSCGTSDDGESFLVEWDESEGSIKRSYLGLDKLSFTVVKFDISKNQLLAAGNDHLIKFWDVDKIEILTTVDADGDLPENPTIRFNKEGTLLAVITKDNRIKILATNNGLQLLRTSESPSIDGSKVLSESLKKLVINPTSTIANAGAGNGGVPVNGDAKNFEDVKRHAESLEDVKSKLTGEAINIANISRIYEIHGPSQCQSLQLPAHVKTSKISRLIYTNAGNAILALATEGFHVLWKWPQTDLNLAGKATTMIPPQFWQPKSGLLLMTNDLREANPEEAVPCFAVSKNDSYVMSASGGKISLFNMMTFKAMVSIMPAPPAATSIAFHPQDNNIIAIGMDDSTIQLYNVRLDKTISKLEGHSQRVTGLAFSNTLNLLVSSGADAQIVVWNLDGWEKQKSTFLHIPGGKMPAAGSSTHIQFHEDQTHFLSVHETHLAIYETKELECVKQWNVGGFFAPIYECVQRAPAPISHAAFSCDSQMVYASFLDGTVSIFDALNLEPFCRINPTAYLPSNKCCSFNVYPLVVAAHPHKTTQFAVGLSDGKVYVLEPPEPKGKWCRLPSPTDGLGSSKDCGYSIARSEVEVVGR